MLNKELVTYQNKLFYVYKKIKQDRIKDGYVNDIKDFWLCDVVVRSRMNNDDTLLFLREIEEAQVVRDVI
jgi:hypothetical protein